MAISNNRRMCDTEVGKMSESVVTSTSPDVWKQSNVAHHVR